MIEHKTKVVVMTDGRVIIDDLPVTKGQLVDVTVEIDAPTKPTYPLRGLPFRLREPFEPAVDESEWNALK